MNYSKELEVEIVRHSFAIKSWVHRLCTDHLPSEDEQTEVSSWIRTLDAEQRARLEEDASRLGSEREALSEIASGPLGELLGRFSSLIQGYRGPSSHANPGSPFPAGPSFSEEIEEILLARSDLERLDPSWFTGWEAFEESLETDD